MINTLVNTIHSQLPRFDLTFNLLNISEILIISIIVFAFYKKFKRNTQAEKLVKGLIFLVFGWIFAEILIRIDLIILGVFLKATITLISLSLIVIFQPELRRFLSYLGQVDFMNKSFWESSHNKQETNIDILKEIIEAVKYLSKTKTGALIVFQNEMDAYTSTDVGTTLNADLSMELLLTIFHINTPLHDGAVVIKGNKILAAGVLLPLTEDPKLSWKYGTRHRAAIGMSEISDSACLVVSEETGDVSVCLDGTLKKYEDLTTLKNDLENILGLKKEEEEKDKKTLFKINNVITVKKLNKHNKNIKEKN